MPEYTYVARVQDSDIVPPNLGEMVALVAQQTVHVTNEAQVFLVATRLADGAAPLFDGLEDLRLDTGVAEGGPLGEASDELVQELLGTDLEMEGIAAVLDTDVEEAEGEQADIGVAGIDVVDDGDGGLARGGALLAVDEVGDLEVEGEVGLDVVGAAGAEDEALQLGRLRVAHVSPAASSRRTGRGSLHSAAAAASLLLGWVSPLWR